jgi:hypothetical protein
MYLIELQDDGDGWTLLLRDGDQTILQSRAASWIQPMAWALEHIEGRAARRK